MSAFSGQVCYAIVGFAGSVLAARLLGADGKGTLTAWTLVAAAGPLLIAGSIPTGLGRAVISNSRQDIVRAAAAHGLIALVVGMTAAAVVLLFFSVDVVTVICFVVVALPAGTVTLDILVAVQAAKRAWAYHGIRTGGAIVFTGGMVALAVAGSSNLEIAYVCWSLGSLASAGLAVWIGSRAFGWSAAGAHTLKRYSRLGGHSYGARLLDAALLRLDQLFVVVLAGPIALGVYSVAVNWAEISQYAGHSIGDAAFEDERTLQAAATGRLLSRAAVLLSCGTALIALSGVAFIPTIFGEEFTEARWGLLLLAPGVAARGVGYTAGQILHARGGGRRLTRITLAAALVGVVLWPVGTVTLGFLGTALASSAVYGLHMVLTVAALNGQATGRGQ